MNIITRFEEDQKDQELKKDHFNSIVQDLEEKVYQYQES